MTYNEIDLEDQADWPRQHDWLAARLNELYPVFVNRVEGLDMSAWQPEDAPEAQMPAV